MPLANRELAGRLLNPIGLGCMNLSHAFLPRPDEAYCERLVNEAIDLGYRHFDSARIYGFGQNEVLLARVIKERRDEMFITSKTGIKFVDGKRYIDCKPETIQRAVDKSLEALGVDKIDLYYLHRLDRSVPIEESVGMLAELKKEGKVGGIGLSEMSAKTLRLAASEVHIDAIQSEYSLWTRNPELGVLQACKENGTAFVAFSPLGRGVLANRIMNIKFEEGDLRLRMPRFSSEHWPKNKALAQQFNIIAAEAGVTPAQLALFWVLSQGDHVHVIPGTCNIDHMKENFTTNEISVSDETLFTAGALINQSTVSGHRYSQAARNAVDTEEFI